MKPNHLAIALFLVLVFSLSGCGTARPEKAETPASPPQASASIPAPAESDAPTAAPDRQDGDRFEAVIMLNGTEETVAYEHARNESAGFALDYEYESLRRQSDPERERFVSLWDDEADPWNYLEVWREAGDSEAVAASVQAALSDAYETVEAAPDQLEGTGACLRIDASGARSGKAPSGSLLTVYVIPTGDSCLVAESHCTFESAEGFGRRFSYMVNTLTHLESRG